MNKIFTLIGTLAVTATAFAGANTTAKFPAPAPVQASGACSYSPLKVAANEGVTMYANTVRDNHKEFSLVRFYSETPYNLERLYSYRPGDKLAVYQPMCGVGVGNDFYTYIVGVYAAGTWLIPNGFEKVDLTTNEMSIIKTKDDFTGDQSDNWPWLYEMTYDETNDICYALGCNFDNADFAESNLYTVDLTTGDYEYVTSLGFYAQGLACDYDGKYLYSSQLVYGNGTDATATGSKLVKIDTDRYNSTDVCTLTRDGADFIPWGFQNTMEFDKATGDLYFMAVSSNYQNLYKVNLENGTMRSYYGFGSNEIGTSLYIPFEKADTREAAARVESLRADAPQGTAATVVLSWTNPVKQWDGAPLTELEEVLICRGSKDNVIATVKPATIGGEMTYTDETAEAGKINVYYVIPCRKSGEKGIARMVTSYAGPDVPGLVGNVTVKADTDTQVTISWEAPTAGLHQGWYDDATTTYDVKCAQTGTIIGKNLAATTVTKAFKQKYNSYSFIITAKNSAGEGGKFVTNPIKMGSALDVPYVEVFNKEGSDSRWDLDPDLSGRGFYYEPGQNGLVFWAPGNESEWTTSAPVNVTAGKTYRVHITTTSPEFSETYAHNFKVAYGTSGKPEAMTNVLINQRVVNEEMDQLHSFTEDFTATSTGVVYFGINCYSTCVSSRFVVKNFSVEMVETNDLAAESIELVSPSVVVDDRATFSVAVRNTGIKAQSAYTVKLITLNDNGDEEELASRNVTKAIAKDEVQNVQLSFTPKAMGEMSVAAVVVLEGDQKESNDKTRFIDFTVGENETGSKWNVDVDNEAARFNPGSEFPFSPSRSTAHAEIIYYADELGIDEEDTYITKLAFEFTNGTAQEKTSDIEIYLGNTDKATYASDGTAYTEWTDLSKLTKVYTGKLEYQDGDGMLVFDFQNPFLYEVGKNLMVRIVKSGAVDYFSPIFVTSLYNFGYFESFSDIIYRSIYLGKNVPFEEAVAADPDNTMVTPWACLLHLATSTKDLSGVNTITVGGAARVAYADGALHFGEGVTSVDVYGLNGALVASKYVAPGATSVAANLENGVYVVRLNTLSGSKSVKVMVTK